MGLLKELWHDFQPTGMPVYNPAMLATLSLLGATALTSAVYVWQSQPSPALTDAAQWACGRFARVNALVMEGKRETTTEASLRAACGDKLEVSFRPSSLEQNLCAQVSRYSIVQIDYDAVPSQLKTYRKWLEELKSCAPLSHISFTALPSWLDSSDFAPLARAHPDFTLQVHWIQKGPNGPRKLYDADKARAAVAKASALGVPFHVALPTYRHVSDARGEVITVDWAALAADVRHWTISRPPHLLGFYWFRLPIEGDENTIPRDVFAKLAHGEAPAKEQPLQFVARAGQNGLVDILIKNSGIEPRAPPRWEAQWTGPAPVARETFKTPRFIPPGEERLVGWLRFARPTEVTILAQDDSDPRDSSSPIR